MSLRHFASSARRALTPRRSLMYVPGSDERKLAKISSIEADCICLDCEDGVAQSKKDAARQRIRKLLDNNDIKFGPISERTVRVNSIESGLCAEDLKVILGGPNLPEALHLPKVENAGQLQEFQRLFAEATQHHKGKIRLGLIVFIESARAMLDLKEICSAAVNENRGLAERVVVPEALVFGSDDFVAEIGATRTPEATELLYARQKLVTAAKAFQFQAIDLVHIDYKDREGLQRQAEEGARMGFTYDDTAG